MLTVASGRRAGRSAADAAGIRTVIQVVSDADPPGPVAVAVYVTDDAGFTERDPWFCTLPISGSM